MITHSMTESHYLFLGVMLVIFGIIGFAEGFYLWHVTNWSATPDWTLSPKEYAKFHEELQDHQWDVLIFDEVILRENAKGKALSWYVETKFDYIFPYDYRGKRAFLLSATTNRLIGCVFILGMTAITAAGVGFISREMCKYIEKQEV